MRYCFQKWKSIVKYWTSGRRLLPSRCQKQLYAVGDWLKVNGEAIYGSRPFTVAAEGPAAQKDENFDIDKLHEQIKNGDAADVRGNELGERDFRFTTNNGNLYVIAMGCRLTVP